MFCLYPGCCQPSQKAWNCQQDHNCHQTVPRTGFLWLPQPLSWGCWWPQVHRPLPVHLTLTILVGQGLPDSAAAAALFQPPQSTVRPQTLPLWDLINDTEAASQHLLVNWHLNGNCQWNISIWLLSCESSAGRNAVGSEEELFLAFISLLCTWPVYTQRHNMTLMLSHKIFKQCIRSAKKSQQRKKDHL